MRTAAVVIAVAVVSGCGGGGGGTPTGPRVISVAGDYTLTVALVENDCGSVVVQPLPTHVEHTPGSGTLRLTHGPNTFDGTLSADGSFLTQPRTLNDGAGGTLVLSISGRFTTAGLDALATVTLERPCRYVVRWTGAKQGSPNVIP